MRLTKLTGKSKYKIHPKHLINIETPWYLSHIYKKDSVLDLGCSNGQHTLKTAKKCHRIIGLDYDKAQLDIARATAKDQKIKNAVFKSCNLEKKLYFKSQTFDKVLCLDILEHVYHRKQLLTEIKRVLKPGGLAFIAIPNTGTSWKKIQKKVGLNYYADPDHKIEYTLTEAKDKMRQIGFKILSLQPIVYDSPWVGIFDFIGGLSLNLYAGISKYKKKKIQNNLKESTGFRIVIKKPSAGS